MSNSLRKAGRLSWPGVIAVMVVSTSIIVFDYVWRVLTVSFESLTIALVVVLFVGGIVLLTAASLLKHRRRNV